jgi:glycosyltransferase involved in cell wall biosynthesis
VAGARVDRLEMKRILMVSPHFPPDSSAATHRLRLLGSYLKEFGWTPTILTVDPRDYESRIDAELLALVPGDLDVVRVRAWSPSWTRRLGFGDLGLRAYAALRRACRKLLEETEHHCFFVTIYPSYPALLGPFVKRQARIPFVLDYQDPWVSAWGSTVGPGTNGAPDLRSRFSRRLATVLEPIAVRSADAITAVSEGTFRAVQERVPAARGIPCVEIPVGFDRADFDYLRCHREDSTGERGDGTVVFSYVGTLLPLGFSTLRAFLLAVSALKERAPSLYAKLRVQFIGTSNQTQGALEERVVPEARRMGVEDVVREEPGRIDYLDALNVLARSSAILLMGSSERHYTASKLYPALLAEKPILAIFHEESSVVSILRRAARPPAARIVTYDDQNPPEARVEAILDALRTVVEGPVFEPASVDRAAVDEFSARSMARRLGALLDRISAKA